MIVIVDTLLFDQPVVAVVNEEFTPPKILSLRKGSYSDGNGHHEKSVADYHAEKTGQRYIDHVITYEEDDYLVPH